MPGKLKHGDRLILTEMNLIPLIDISLVLLIIFMVLTPVLVRSQLQVQLPKASAGSGVSKSIEVTLTKDGKVFVDGKQTTLALVEKELQMRLGSAREKTVLVQADREVPIERVVKVFDAGKRLGVGKLGIGVTSTEKP
jgi:biopolymer transport protein ExbD